MTKNQYKMTLSNRVICVFVSSPLQIFYFSNGKGFPGQAEFKDRVQFVGDINKRDASIQLNPAQFSDNGTYFCDVKNPPDVQGTQARTELRVVLKGEDAFINNNMSYMHV